MARQNDEDSLSEELESRLDDLFGEDDKYSEGPVTEDSAQDYPLSELKNLVLSIDWEITDEVLQKFIGQIRDLKTTYKDDKINLTFLQILGSLGEQFLTIVYLFGCPVLKCIEFGRQFVFRLFVFFLFVAKLGVLAVTIHRPRQYC